MSIRKNIFLFFMLSHLLVFSQEKSRGIVPDYINMQFAGNIGSVSAGAGYYLNPKKSLNLEGIYGYSPAYRTGRAIHNIVLRINYKPFCWHLNEKLQFKPFVSYALSKQIADNDRTFGRLPKNFPEGYYAPNAFRMHFDVGVSLYKMFDPRKRGKGISFYVATTTNEMYVQYYFNSREVKLGDIFSLTVGLNYFLF